MARTLTSCQQAIIYLEILRCMSKHTKRSTEEILNMLHARGIHIELLTLQRYLKKLSESEPAYVERDNSSKPFGYKFKTTANAFVQNLTIEESLLFKLVQERLRYQLPSHSLKISVRFLNWHSKSWTPMLVKTLEKDDGRIR